MKNIEKKTKNREKKFELKTINRFLVSRFITSYLYKFKKIVDYPQNVMPIGNSKKRPNRSNLIYPNHSLRCKAENRL